MAAVHTGRRQPPQQLGRHTQVDRPQCKRRTQKQTAEALRWRAIALDQAESFLGSIEVGLSHCLSPSSGGSGRDQVWHTQYACSPLAPVQGARATRHGVRAHEGCCRLRVAVAAAQAGSRPGGQGRVPSLAMAGRTAG